MQWTKSIEKNVFSRSFCWTLSCDILLPKLFWPTVRKKCSSDWEKLFKLFKSNKMFCENAVAWKLKLSFRKELKHILTFLLHDIRLQKIRPLWWTTTYISPKAKTIQSSVLTHFTSGVSNVTVRIDIKKQNKKEFKLNLQTGVCTWFDLWSSQVSMGSNPVWTCILIHFSGTLLKKIDFEVRHHQGAFTNYVYRTR